MPVGRQNCRKDCRAHKFGRHAGAHQWPVADQNNEGRSRPGTLITTDAPKVVSPRARRLLLALSGHPEHYSRCLLLARMCCKTRLLLRLARTLWSKVEA